MPGVGTSAYNTVRQVTDLVRSLLNDNGYPGLPIPITAIVRAANVVTVTTLGACGVIAGDQVMIAGVTDSANFPDGTYTVVAGSGYQYTVAWAGANVSSSGGTSTGVSLGNVWTDGRLIAFVNSAYRIVQRALAMTGVTTFKTDNVTVVVAKVANVDSSAQVVIDESTAPPNNLPADLLEPLKLWEREDGSDEDFQEMTDATDVGGLPPISQGAVLRYWEWREDGIYFVGATVDREIRIRYRKSLPVLVDGASTILIRNSQECIAFTTAALAAESLGSALADKYDQAAQDSFEKLTAASTRSQQRRGRRRRSFRTRRGLRSGYFF